MTATPAPVTSNEHDSHLFHNTRNRIASLSSKNKEILDQISQLHQSHSQALSVINSQLDIPHSTTSTVQDIDNLVNNLNLTSRQRRNSNLQQQSVASVRPESSITNKNVGNVMEVERNNELNETTGSIDNTLSFTGRSSKLSIANRNSKDSIRMDNLSPNANNVGEDWKYLLAEHNSDSENANEISGSVDDKEFKINDDSSNRRRNSKSHPTLTINTKSSKPTRLITPESSDSEFDISNAHMPLASSLGGGINPLRVPRHSSAELYKGSIIERRGRPISMTFSSMDEVIEEERGSLSDIAEQEAANVRASDNSVRARNRLLANRKKRGQKYADDFNEGTDVSSVSRTNKINNRLQADEYSLTDIHDDNSSIMSNESFIDELNALRSRIRKLEAERVNIDDDSTSEKRSRKKKSTSDQAISPSATSPAFTTSDQSTNDASPPPSHSMAMVVSTALYLNSNLRNVTAQMESGGQPSEKYMKVLLKTSDEQIRSLTECLLALGPLALKKTPTKKDSCSSLLQTPTSAHTTRSISPIQRIPSTSSEMSHHEIHQGVDHSARRISPTPPTDLSSPTYYTTTQRTSRYRISRPPSPSLPPENIYDSQFTQVPSSRAADYRERRSRRYSGSTYGGSYSGPFPPPSSSPPPPLQSSHYDQSNGRSYLDREIPRLQRYNNSVPPTTNTTSYQRSSSRPTSLVQDSSYNIGHMRSSSNSSLYRSSSGRSITQRSDEFVSSPVSTSRQPRAYEYARRYQSENGQSQFDRRQAPISEMDRRYGRRVGGNYDSDEVFDGQNGYGDHVSDRDYTLREEKSVLRKEEDSNNSTGSVHKQRLAPPPEEQTHNGSVESREESRNESQDEIRNDGGQEGRQTDNTNNDNVVENGGYI
ncbi:14410_t:CDS:2 [Dentiscutata heterogama]|uniref:14410_t:CDS:1 n=1 Tax=Dentiscutata heterogama TaxID=1316150 RepID=A0ACA9LBY6_9GLOM|nr:14410_t:CDS:2 [Dentiscutata heterogama]